MIATALAFVLEHWPWLAGLAGAGGLAATALIPGAGPVLAFLRANWQWAIPSAISVLAVGWALWERGDYQSCKAARVADQLAHAQAIIDQKNKDRALADGIIQGQADTIAKLAAKTNTHTEIIRNVPVTTACPDAPAMRAADDGLLDLGFKRAPRPAAGVDAAKAGGAPARP